ncbi:hypothetical protein CRUP_037630 [Coryphaenoides rupestris]|nr:hypothetical protein CRUP_037630 [Coryphaenoides rupestris]
MAAWGRT